jgi:hypothetical protein
LLTRIQSDNFKPFQSAEMALDVYSFSMILYEIMSNQLTWGNLNLEAILGKVKDGVRPIIFKGMLPADLQYYPLMTDDKWDQICDRFSNIPEITDLMEKSWNQDPGARPTFEQISLHLQESFDIRTDNSLLQTDMTYTISHHFSTSTGLSIS